MLACAVRDRPVSEWRVFYCDIKIVIGKLSILKAHRSVYKGVRVELLGHRAGCRIVFYSNEGRLRPHVCRHQSEEVTRTHRGLKYLTAVESELIEDVIHSLYDRFGG